MPYYNAYTSLPGCVLSESERKTRDVILKELASEASSEINACTAHIKQRANADNMANKDRMLKAYNKLREDGQAAARTARQEAIDSAIPAE